MDDSTKNRLRIEVKKAYYVYERYNVISTFALLYHDGDITFEALGGFLRISDHFLRVDKNHCFIVFTHTEQNNAFKASQNLLVYLDKYFNNRASAVALDNFDTSLSCLTVLNRLTQILNETKKNPDSRIEDENILNGLV